MNEHLRAANTIVFVRPDLTEKRLIPVEQDARILRVVCSSGAFVLKGPVIDAKLVQRQVIELQSAITEVWSIIDHLLAEPGAFDTVHIEGMTMRLDESGVLIGDQSSSRPPSEAHRGGKR